MYCFLVKLHLGRQIIAALLRPFADEGDLLCAFEAGARFAAAGFFAPFVAAAAFLTGLFVALRTRSASEAASLSKDWRSADIGMSRQRAASAAFARQFLMESIASEDEMEFAMLCLLSMLTGPIGRLHK
jgi:hypothetical protein